VQRSLGNLQFVPPETEGTALKDQQRNGAMKMKKGGSATHTYAPKHDFRSASRRIQFCQLSGTNVRDTRAFFLIHHCATKIMTPGRGAPQSPQSNSSFEVAARAQWRIRTIESVRSRRHRDAQINRS
jgi:hypothetical protein